METSIIVFETKVDKFSKRFIKGYYPAILVFTAFLLMSASNVKKDNLVFWLFVLSIAIIILAVEYKYCYKRTYIKIRQVILKDGWFNFEIIKGDEVEKKAVAKDAIRAILKFEGNNATTAHLIILSGTEKVFEIYAINKRWRPQQLDEIAYKINAQAKA